MVELDTPVRLNDAPLTLSREAQEGVQEKTSLPHEYNNIRFNAGAIFNRRNQLPRRRENDRSDAYGRQYQVIQRGGYNGHTRDPLHHSDRLNARRTHAGNYKHSRPNNKQIQTYSTRFDLYSVHAIVILTYHREDNERSI